MDSLTEILLTLLGAGGAAGGLFKWWSDKQNAERQDEKDRLSSLELQIKYLSDKVDTLTDEKLQLSVKIARLEERLLLNAKNRVGKRGDKN